jgi:hypothetical protein
MISFVSNIENESGSPILTKPDLSPYRPLLLAQRKLKPKPLSTGPTTQQLLQRSLHHPHFSTDWHKNIEPWFPHPRYQDGNYFSGAGMLQEDLYRQLAFTIIIAISKFPHFLTSFFETCRRSKSQKGAEKSLAKMATPTCHPLATRHISWISRCLLLNFTFLPLFSLFEQLFSIIPTIQAVQVVQVV